MSAAVDRAVVWLRDAAPIQSSFIPTEKLVDYFRDHISEIFREIFTEENRPNPEGILNSQGDGYLGVFATLLLIGHPYLISKFSRIPYLSDSFWRSYVETGPPYGFPAAQNGKDIWKDFQDNHWQFYPHRFVNHSDDIEIHDKTPLPFLQKTPIGAGRSAKIFKVEIHRHYDQLACLVIFMLVESN
jgi:hypothetical protein